RRGTHSPVAAGCWTGGQQNDLVHSERNVIVKIVKVIALLRRGLRHALRLLITTLVGLLLRLLLITTRSSLRCRLLRSWFWGHLRRSLRCLLVTLRRHAAHWCRRHWRGLHRGGLHWGSILIVHHGGRGAVRPHVVAGTIQHHHVVGDDFSGVTLNPVFFPFTGTQTAFKVGAAAFFQVLLADFRQFAVHGNTVPFGLFNFLAGGFVVIAFVGGQVDVGHGVAVGHITNFRVTSQSTNECHFVNAATHAFLLLFR